MHIVGNATHFEILINTCFYIHQISIGQMYVCMKLVGALKHYHMWNTLHIRNTQLYTYTKHTHTNIHNTHMLIYMHNTHSSTGKNLIYTLERLKE